METGKVKDLYHEVAETVTHLTAILEVIERGGYGPTEAKEDLDNLDFGAIRLILNDIIEGSDK